MKKKKRSIIFFLLLVEITSIFFMFKSYGNKTLDVPSEKMEIHKDGKIDKQKFNMYIQKNDGTYEEYTESNVWPANYILNTSLVSCTDLNGDSVNVEVISNGNKVTVTSNKTVFCYLYFDISVNINFYNNENYIYDANSLLVTLSGRDFYKANNGGALIGYVYRNEAWTGPLLVSENANSVAFTQTYDGLTSPSRGSFTYNDTTYYYSSANYFMAGNQTDTSGLNRTKYTDSNQNTDTALINAAKELIDDNSSTEVQEVGFNSSVTLNSNVYEKQGYTFAGWSTSPTGNVEYDDGDTITVSANSDINLYAIWERNDYKIRYYENPDYISGADSVIIRLNGRNYYKENNEGALVGYYYDGTWTQPLLISKTESAIRRYTDYDSDTVFGTTMEMTYEGERYYVGAGGYSWQGDMYDQANLGRLRITNSAFASYLLAHDFANYTESTVSYEDKLTLSANTYTRDGYSFAGWSTSPTGSVEYNDLSKLVVNTDSDIKLYAIWEPNTYTINYYSNPDYFADADGLIVRLNGRSYYKRTNDGALVAYRYGGAYTGPLVVSDTQDGVKRYSSYDTSATYTYDGTITYDGVTYYVGTSGVPMAGDLTDEANLGRKKYSNSDGTNLENALALLQSNVSTVSQQVSYGKAVTLTANTYTKTNYTFSGWSTIPTGTKTYNNSQKIVYNTKGNLKLYALWTSSASVANVNLIAKKKTANTAVASGTYSNEGLNFTFTTDAATSTIYYCKDTTNTCTPSTIATSGTAVTAYNTITSGTYYIRYKVTNGSGLSSSVYSYTAVFDVTAPVIKLTYSGNNYSGTITDSASKVVGYKVTTSTTTPTSWDGVEATTSFTMPSTTRTAAGTFYVHAKDGAGNTGYNSMTIIALPIGKNETKNFNYVWNVQPVCASSNTSIATCSVTGSAGSWVLNVNGIKGGTSNITLTVGSGGNTAVVYRTTVYEAPTAPTITASDSKASGNWHTANFNLTFSGSSIANGSGSVTYFYGTSTSSMTNTASSVAINSETASTTYYVKACNSSYSTLCSTTVSYVAKLDKTSPVIKITSYNGSNFSGTITESISKVTAYAITTSSSTPTSWTSVTEASSINIPSTAHTSGTKYIHAKNSAGKTGYTSIGVSSTTISAGSSRVLTIAWTTQPVCSTSNSSYATCSVSGSAGAWTLSINGVAAGSAVITVTVGSGGTIAAAYRVTVTSGPILNVNNTYASTGSSYNGAWTNGRVKSVLTFSDTAGINASSLQWSNDGTNWHSMNNTSTSTATDEWSSEIDGYGYYKICNNNSKCTTVSFVLRIDTTPPTVSMSKNGATITVTCNDAHSPTGGQTYTAGSPTLSGTCSDAAGNTKSYTYNYSSHSSCGSYCTSYSGTQDYFACNAHSTTSTCFDGTSVASAGASVCASHNLTYSSYYKTGGEYYAVCSGVCSAYSYYTCWH